MSVFNADYEKSQTGSKSMTILVKKSLKIIGVNSSHFQLWLLDQLLMLITVKLCASPILTG